MIAQIHERVLKECGIRDRPVSLDRILRHYDIEQVALPADSNICGAIIRQNGRVLIAVNSNQALHRQRFTIAHELAHYFSHRADAADMQHVDSGFCVDWHSSGSKTRIDWEEIEANRFAAALLIPEHLLRRDIVVFGSIDTALARHLALLYRVSSVAMQYRLIHLGILPPGVDPSTEMPEC